MARLDAPLRVLSGKVQVVTQLYKISGSDEAERKADVVFIHGLGGDAFTTWRYGKDEKTFWPRWLGEDFPEIGIWSLGYPASPTKCARVKGWFSKKHRDSGYSSALPDRGLQVLDLMMQRGFGKRPILFICHSLGGLLAKQILRKAHDDLDPSRKQIAIQTRAVLFLATPHTGSELASKADSFRRLFGTTVSVEELRAHDSRLRDLLAWYRHRAEDQKIRTATYYESRPVKGVLPIVDPSSAHPGTGSDPVSLDEDHISIAKPHARECQVYGGAQGLIREVLDHAKETTPSHEKRPGDTPDSDRMVKVPQSKVFVIAESRRIPHELPPAAEKFFGRKKEKDQLVERLRKGKNTAVVGPAGLGKTALAAEAVREVVGDTVDTLAASPFPDGVVFIDFYTVHGQADPAWHKLAFSLGGVEFLPQHPDHERAAAACQGRHALIIIEGGEEADGEEGRVSFNEWRQVLSPENRVLLLTRVSTQAIASESVFLRETLSATEAAALLDQLTGNDLTAPIRNRVLEILEGHPLALTWAGNLLGLGDDDPERLLSAWQDRPLSDLTDPTQAEHTLHWLFERSASKLNPDARLALKASGLVSRAPFPLATVCAAFDDANPQSEETARGALKTLVRYGLLRRGEESDYWEHTHVLGYRFSREIAKSDSDLCERLGAWLGKHLRALLTSPAGDDLARVPVLLEDAGALMRADVGSRLWSVLVKDLMYDTRNRLVDLGQLSLVKLALTPVDTWLDTIQSESEAPEWLREGSVILGCLGDVQLAQGDLSGALGSYRESLSVVEGLAASDATNPGWKRDLSVSLDRIGDVRFLQGDLTGALDTYRKSLTVMEDLANVDPPNAGMLRSLSVCYTKEGNVQFGQGNLTGALDTYRKALTVMEGLAEEDASNAGWHHDLSSILVSVGDMQFEQGDLRDALDSYLRSLAVMQGLVGADTMKAGFQRGLSLSYNKVGDAQLALKDLTSALDSYGKSLVVMQNLVETDASNAGWKQDLSVSYNKMGDVQLARNDLSGALGSYCKSLAMMEGLAKTDTSNTGWKRDLSVIHNRVGDVLSAQGDHPGAMSSYLKSLNVMKALAESNASFMMWQRDLSFTFFRLAQSHDRLGNHAEALQYALQSLKIVEKLARLDPFNATWQKDLAYSTGFVSRLQKGVKGAG